MRNIGVFTTKPVRTVDLIELVQSHSLRVRQPCARGHEETVVGRLPDLVHVSDRTVAEDGYFGDEELKLLESKLGSGPQGYVDIHFFIYRFGL